MPVLISTSTSVPAPSCGVFGYEMAREIRTTSTVATISSEPTTTASAVRHERFDIGGATLLRAPLAVEPALQDQRGGLLVDHALALLARQISLEQHALGLRGGEPL